MSEHSMRNKRPPKRVFFGLRRHSGSKSAGQALIEYALILALVVIAVIAVLAITGPAVGNVFSNQVYNLLGGDVEPYETLAPDEFWTQVAAVASYTPESPSLVTNTPAPVTKTFTPGPTQTPSPITPSPLPTSTNTPGPSPTPPDQTFGYPFVDPGDHPDWWQHDFDNLITNPWNAEYWGYCSSCTVRTWLADMTSLAAGTGDKRETVATLDYYLSSSTAPSSGVNTNYYARYTTTITMENKEYIFRVMFDTGLRIWLDSTLVVETLNGKPSWAQESGNTLMNKWWDQKFTGLGGEHTITVEFVDQYSAANLHVFMIEDGNLDKGDCSWALSDEQYYSPATAWSDSPGAAYKAGSYCILSLRGTIDLTGATDPKLQFYDRYNLRSGTKAMVGISVAGTSTWVEDQLHYQSTDLTWARQTYDLKNFKGQDFRGQRIEVRFVLDATASTSTYDGWWIDDIRVEEEIHRVYTVGFVDDMEGTSHWYPSGTWARSNEASHSTTTAWSDSPGGNYINGTNSTLELDGIIDLSDPRVDDPQVLFWQRYNLNSGDYIYAEVSTDRITWTMLTGTYLAYQSSDWGFTQLILSLAAYDNQQIYFRFRLDARNGSAVGDGWWIDDYELRNKPQAVVYPDWCDSMENGAASWTAEGTWGVASGFDYNSYQSTNATIYPHTGANFWSDSPGGNYLHNTDSSLQLTPKLDLTASVDPEMVFWDQWDLAYSDDVYVEVSTDDAATWIPIWNYYYNGLPPGYCTTSGCIVNDGSYNHMLSWTRESVSLKDYIGQKIYVRFRIDSTYDPAVDNGWFVDDICFQEHVQTVAVPPFSDGFESGTNNWYQGGTWGTSSESVNPRLTGSRSISDTPGTMYTHESNAILELKPTIDLTGTVEPTLYYWEAFNITTRDYALVEVRTSTDGGTTWNDWTEITSGRRMATTTLSWDRRQIDLRPYIPTVSTPDLVIRLRFRLYSANNTSVADGWWIDDVSIVDRYGKEPTFTRPFYEDVDFANNYWVYDGTWDRVSLYRMVGSGSGLGPGTWTGKYYYDANSNRAFDSGEYRFTYPGIEKIEFNWGDCSSCRPGLPSGSTETALPSGDRFLARWTRTISIAENNTQLTINTYSDDGIRVIVDPPGDPDSSATYPNGWSWNVNAWVDRSYPSTPDAGTVTLNQGMHTILVEYYENSGSARVRVDFGKWGKVFHDSPNAGSTLIPYLDKSDMSVTLEGMVDLTSASTPALTYEDSRSLGSGDYIYTEISTDGGFTWVSVRSASGIYTTWTKRFFDLSAFIGQKINIRFRLDARSNSNVDDGWYVDNIVVAE